MVVPFGVGISILYICINKGAQRPRPLPLPHSSSSSCLLKSLERKQFELPPEFLCICFFSWRERTKEKQRTGWGWVDRQGLTSKYRRIGRKSYSEKNGSFLSWDSLFDFGPSLVTCRKQQLRLHCLFGA